eukprot:Selendium_serpulae@DN901_c0_g1_i1.p2
MLRERGDFSSNPPPLFVSRSDSGGHTNHIALFKCPPACLSFCLCYGSQPRRLLHWLSFFLPFVVVSHPSLRVRSTVSQSVGRSVGRWAVTSATARAVKRRRARPPTDD